MPLTPAQLQTLKTTIQGDSSANTLYVAGNLQGLADYYNQVASPDFWVWRTRVTRDELVGSTSIDATVFSWTGAGFLTRSQGERDGFSAIFDSEGAVNPARPQVRQAFADIFSGGTAPAPANRTHLLTVSRRKATRLERVFATGTGSTASPGLLVAEGAMSHTELIGL